MLLLLNKLLFKKFTSKILLRYYSHHFPLRSEGLFERKREFVYTRYVFRSQDSYFIIQQSLKDSAITTGFSKPLKIASCRGTINYFSKNNIFYYSKSHPLL